mmetsp:Transcript_12606/g.23702  ORF Transcript_12606/g.23702 Transcript_12606/m.23702 type:complete len:340 (-) Transcript_12606:25-1044(-)
MLSILDLLGGRGCLAPEDICRLGAVCPDWRTFSNAEAVWLVLARTVRLRPLPQALRESDAGEGLSAWLKEPQAAKAQLLERYRPVFAVRQRVRRLWRRVTGFWNHWAPDAACALQAGATEASLRQAEAKVESELPEDLAESLRCCDGHEKEAFWFAEAAPGALAFRVARLLPLRELVQEQAGPGWLPVARSREGGLTCCRVQPKVEGSVGFYGELWCSSATGRVERSDWEEWNLTRQTTCFLDYLQDYVSLLEGLPAQWAEHQLLSTTGLGSALQQLFRSPRIYCDEQGGWITTGLGKGKGNLWQRLDRSQPVRIIFPPSLGKTGKRRASFAQSWLLGK